MATSYESYDPQDREGADADAQGPYASPMASVHEPSARQDLQQPMVGSEPGKRSWETYTRYRDVPFAVLFLVQLFVVLVIAIANSHRVVSDLPSAGALSAKTLRVCAVACLTAGALGVGWLALLKRHARSLIWASAGASVVLYVATAIWLLTGRHGSSVALGLLLLVAAGLQCAYLRAVRGRVSFSAALLSTVAGLVQGNPMLVTVALGAVAVSAAWLLVWSVAMSYTLHARLAGGAGAPQGFLVLLLVLSFLWTVHVAKNVVHVAVAGSVGSWYFLSGAQGAQGDAAASAEATRQALRRALTTSFGSVCLGSLVVSIVRALRLAASAASRRAGPGVVRSCLLCALGFLDVLVRFFNQYAFTHVALYGKHFTSASRDTWALLVRCGIDILVQHDMIGSVLAMGCVVGGLANALVLGAWARAIFDNDVHQWMPVVLVVFLIGAGALLLVSAVVESAVAALYVCYAEDPNALATVQPHLYAMFVNANHAMPMPQASLDGDDLHRAAEI